MDLYVNLYFVKYITKNINNDLFYLLNTLMIIFFYFLTNIFFLYKRLQSIYERLKKICFYINIILIIFTLIRRRVRLKKMEQRENN